MVQRGSPHARRRAESSLLVGSQRKGSPPRNPRKLYDSSMPADANARANSVGNSPPARLVQALRHCAQSSTRADSGLPSAVVHTELLEIDQVNDEGSVRATQAIVPTIVRTNISKTWIGCANPYECPPDLACTLTLCAAAHLMMPDTSAAVCGRTTPEGVTEMSRLYGRTQSGW